MLRATAFALTVIGVCATPAFASGLKATQTVERATVTVNADGTESVTYRLAEDVAPGEQVRYGLTYTNEGSETAENVSLVMPIPAQVTYLEGSAAGTPGEITFSTDAGQSFAARETLMVKDGLVTRLADATELTHIKWVIPGEIAPNETGSVSFEGVLK